MKLVDMKDLKSFGPNGPCRFESCSGYYNKQVSPQAYTL